MEAPSPGHADDTLFSRRGITSSSDHSKPCSLCHTARDVLVRCQTSPTSDWQFLCPGRCWRSVSGGVVDGDGYPEHKGYRYGGMWKNKHARVSAKMPKKVKRKQREMKGDGRRNVVGGATKDDESHVAGDDERHSVKDSEVME